MLRDRVAMDAVPRVEQAGRVRGLSAAAAEREPEEPKGGDACGHDFLSFRAPRTGERNQAMLIGGPGWGSGVHTSSPARPATRCCALEPRGRRRGRDAEEPGCAPHPDRPVPLREALRVVASRLRRRGDSGARHRAAVRALRGARARRIRGAIVAYTTAGRPRSPACRVAGPGPGLELPQVVIDRVGFLPSASASSFTVTGPRAARRSAIHGGSARTSPDLLRAFDPVRRGQRTEEGRRMIFNIGQIC